MTGGVDGVEDAQRHRRDRQGAAIGRTVDREPVGAITGVDGKHQITFDGWPLYYFAKDTKAGDVTGQGVGKVWWVLGADGSKISKVAGDSYGGY